MRTLLEVLRRFRTPKFIGAILCDLVAAILTARTGDPLLAFFVLLGGVLFLFVVAWFLDRAKRRENLDPARLARQPWKWSVFAMALLGLVAAAAIIIVPPSQDFSGRFVDRHGHPASRVPVLLYESGREFPQRTITDDSGHYQFTTRKGAKVVCVAFKRQGARFFVTELHRDLAVFVPASAPDMFSVRTYK